MDLKIKDVAELLRVSPTTIRRWLREGKIPAYKLNHQFRFSKIEVEEWVMGCKSGKKERCSSPFSGKIKLTDEQTKKTMANKIGGGTQVYSLFRAIHKGGVIDNVGGETKEEVIKESVGLIAEALSLDDEVLCELLLDREELMPTSLNDGIAVPHTRDFLLPKTFDVVTVVYLKQPIDYGALDGKKVHALFFLFACEDKRHLHLLAKLAHFAREQENLNFLQKHPDKESLLSFIKRWELNKSIIL